MRHFATRCGVARHGLVRCDAVQLDGRQSKAPESRVGTELRYSAQVQQSHSAEVHSRATAQRLSAGVQCGGTVQSHSSAKVQ